MEKYFQNERARKACKIYEALEGGKNALHLSFHTPGHKQNGWDMTELSYLDNLASPSGCIAEAEKDIAEILGAQKSFLLTDGSTSGVLSMLYAAKTLGVRTLAAYPDSHVSFWNGCKLTGIVPFCFEEWDEGLFAEVDGFFLTSPTYYGKVENLQKFRDYCDKTGKPLLIDGAHGGHLHFEKKLYAGSYADMWVDGVHKSLPALTQGAVVSARENFVAALREGVGIFRTSSPSYPVMASVEYAVKYPRNLALEHAVRAWARECERITVREDWTKVCAAFGERAFEANEALEKQGVYAEFCDGENILFYLSPCTSEEELSSLQAALNEAFERYPYRAKKVVQRNPAPLVCVKNKPTEWVKADNATGKLCAADCGLFPPCVPLIRAGERVEREKLELLLRAPHCYGLAENRMLIVKEE